MTDKDNKISLIFIINGENFAIDVNLNEPLKAAVQKALAKSNNTGRPPEEWEARDSGGVLLEKTRTIKDLGIKDGTRLFLSLRVGAGGNDSSRS